MEDQHKWRDKFELSLDNRQIFLFFAASTVVISLVFALGVVVGKRLDPVVAAVPKQDPLALLDQVGASDDSLTFAETLSAAKPALTAPTNDDKGAGATVKKNATLAHTGVKGEATSKPPTSANRPLAAVKGPPKPNTGTARGQARTRVVKHQTRTADRRGRALAEKQAQNIAKQAQLANRVLSSAMAQARRAKQTKDQTAQAKQAKAKQAKAKQAKQNKEHEDDPRGYALQLSAFQNRHEAEQYVLKLRRTGYSPEMVRATIPGRGLWYRVRMGNFKSWKEAIEAKVQFERQQSTIAYVSRR